MPSDHEDPTPSHEENPRDAESTEDDEVVAAFERDRLLAHPTREAIVDLLAERPGMNKSQLCQALSLDADDLDHHLKRLEDGHRVATRSSIGRRETLCFRAEDVQLWEDESTRVLYGSSKSRLVALYLTEHPSSSTREISRALRISPVTVRYHLTNLQVHGLVHRHRAGQAFVYEPNDVLNRWVREVGEGFGRSW